VCSCMFMYFCVCLCMYLYFSFVHSLFLFLFPSFLFSFFSFLFVVVFYFVCLQRRTAKTPLYLHAMEVLTNIFTEFNNELNVSFDSCKQLLESNNLTLTTLRPRRNRIVSSYTICGARLARPAFLCPRLLLCLHASKSK